MDATTISNADELLEILRHDANDDGVFEICIRDINKKFKTFTKYVLNENSINNNENIENMFKTAINKIDVVDSKSTAILNVCNSIKAFQTVGIVVNVLNLCATAAGFYILNKKVEQLYNKVDEVVNTLRNTNMIMTNYKFREISLNYSNMLDYQRRGKIFPEESHRQLIDMQYNFLEQLLEIYNKDLYTAKEDIYALIMLVVEMMYNTELLFDESYFFENKDLITGDDYFHMSHSTWDGIYDKLLNDDFIDSIFDYIFIELHCSSQQADNFVALFIQKCQSAKQYVELNQRKLKAINSIEKYKILIEDVDAIVSQKIKDTLDESELYAADPKSYNEVMNLAQKAGY